MSYKTGKFLQVGTTIFANEAAPNIDYKWGPYASKDDAVAQLKKTGGLCVGQTVGILNADGSVDEFWFKTAAAGAGDLVKKIVAQQTVNAYTKAETDAKLAEKANASELATKANKATTLSGYGIADAFTKVEVTSAISGATQSIQNAVSASAESAESAAESASSAQSRAVMAEGSAAIARQAANAAEQQLEGVSNKLDQMASAEGTSVNDLIAATMIAAEVEGVKADINESMSILSSHDYQDDTVDVVLDAENKILEKTTIDGTKIFCTDVKFLGKVEFNNDDEGDDGGSQNGLEKIYKTDDPERVLIETDDEGKVFHSVDASGSHYFPDIRTDCGFTNLLKGKELFTIGDSLSASGVWQKTVADITGCTFDQDKNSLAGFQLSTGGTATYGGNRDSALGRILNMKLKGYKPDIILLQNVNDGNAINSSGNLSDGSTIEDKAIFINKFVEGYSLESWNNNPSSILSSITPEFGTCILLTRVSNGVNLKITSKATTEGDITLTVNTGKTGALKYNVHVLPSDSIEDINNKILEYDYSGATDTLANDGASVDFADDLNSVAVTFNGNNTGVNATITTTNTAKLTTPTVFVGNSLSDWNNATKWTTRIGFYPSFKGLIEFIKINFPKAFVAVVLFPNFAMNPNDYINADGTFKQIEYNNDKKNRSIILNMQKEVANLYNVPVIDVHFNCGITPGNYLQYYTNNNVHPKTEGYEYFGTMIAKQLLSLI